MQINQPIVTVLMPAYNAGLYIKEAIESVLAQSYTHFEFLIINDGSTDDTEAIIKSYNDSRIIIHTQTNQGVIGALNQGLKLARGEYIARFDADDICYPGRLLIQRQFMEENKNCVLSGSACDYIDKEGNFLFEWQPGAYNTNEIKNKIFTSSPFDHPTVMFRKETALQIGGYPAGALHFEDHLFWTQFFKYGDVANMPIPLIKHRFNPESVTIDEKWRGKEFKKIKYRSIRAGKMETEDIARLRAIAEKQDVKKYKEAAYYSMIAKKYLWDQYDQYKAREGLRRAISILPYKAEPYLLYLFSFLPEKWVKGIYKNIKRN